jgi:hypothetical protein
MLSVDSLKYLKHDKVYVLVPDPTESTNGLVVCGQIYDYVASGVPFDETRVAKDLPAKRDNGKPWPAYVTTRTMGYDHGFPPDPDRTSTDYMEDNMHYDILLPLRVNIPFLSFLRHRMDENGGFTILERVPRWHILSLVDEDEPIEYQRSVRLPINKKLMVRISDDEYRIGAVVDVAGKFMEPIVACIGKTMPMSTFPEHAVNQSAPEPDGTEDWRQTHANGILAPFGTFVDAPAGSLKTLVLEAVREAFKGLVTFKVTGCYQKDQFDTYYGFAKDIKGRAHYFAEKTHDPTILADPFLTHARDTNEQVPRIGDVVIGKVIEETKNQDRPNIQWFIPTTAFVDYFLTMTSNLKRRPPTDGTEWALLRRGDPTSAIIKELVATRFWWV